MLCAFAAPHGQLGISSRPATRNTPYKFVIYIYILPPRVRSLQQATLRALRSTWAPFLDKHTSRTCRVLLAGNKGDCRGDSGADGTEVAQTDAKVSDTVRQGRQTDRQTDRCKEIYSCLPFSRMLLHSLSLAQPTPLVKKKFQLLRYLKSGCTVLKGWWEV